MEAYHLYTLILHFVSFVVIPITVETTVCLNPSPTHRGVVCNWEEKKWVKKFDMETKQYYYELEDVDSTDNCIEKIARERYHNK